MTSKSSFLQRLSLSRNDSPMLPYHNQTSPPLRQHPSEYDLSELSPRPDDALLPFGQSSSHRRSSSDHRSSSPSARYSDHASSAGSESKNKERLLFAGPPPPIATSAFLYRDEEDATLSRAPPQRPQHGTTASFARNAFTSVSSVLFERGSSANSTIRKSRAIDGQTYEPDTILRNLQRRERTLQKELQRLLDAQSDGLAAGLDPTRRPVTDASAVLTGNGSNASDAGSATPTGVGMSVSSANTRHPYSRHVSFDSPYDGRSASAVIPVRQPRRKTTGLPSARKGLAQNMSALVDLKGEEDGILTAALEKRKRALTHLKRLAGRRKGIVEELNALERDDQGSLGQELGELGREREAVSREIVEMEERLAGLRTRKRQLDGQIEDVENEREAGLSGYRNALKEVDANVLALLKRPPVKPLDLEAIGTVRRDEYGNDIEQDLGDSPGGVEFLRLPPGRRTVNMARDWWEREVKILEDRKGEVAKDTSALEEGIQVWHEAVQLVSDFEINLQKGMKGEMLDDGKGTSKPPSREEVMRAAVKRMSEVIAALELRLRTAELRNWNLLICAIGAELEAFREGERVLREVLGIARSDSEDQNADTDDDEGRTPQFGRSMSGKVSPVEQNGSRESNNLVDLQDDTGTAESDNEVPLDLLVAHEEEDDQSAVRRSSSTSRHNEKEDSENEVPPDLLVAHEAEHDEQSPVLGTTSTDRHDDREYSENEVPPGFLTEQQKGEGVE